MLRRSFDVLSNGNPMDGYGPQRQSKAVRSYGSAQQVLETQRISNASLRTA